MGPPQSQLQQSQMRFPRLPLSQLSQIPANQEALGTQGSVTLGASSSAGAAPSTAVARANSGAADVDSDDGQATVATDTVVLDWWMYLCPDAHAQFLSIGLHSQKGAWNAEDVLKVCEKELTGPRIAYLFGLGAINDTGNKFLTQNMVEKRYKQYPSRFPTEGMMSGLFKDLKALVLSMLSIFFLMLIDIEKRTDKRLPAVVPVGRPERGHGAGRGQAAR